MAGSSAFDQLLTQCRDLAITQLDAALSAMLAKSGDALGELATKTQDREAQKRYLELKDLLRSKGSAIEKTFHQRFLSEVQQRNNKARKIGGSFSDASVSTLELVADDDGPADRHAALVPDGHRALGPSAR